MKSTRKKNRHGMTYTPEYTAWCNMKNRCYNTRHPQYHDYGGRGIKVCDEWINSFTAFIKYVGKKPHPTYSLDRIDTDKNYTPDNVRWADRRTQSINQRRIKQTVVNGIVYECQKSAAAKVGITPAGAWYRRKFRGMSYDESILSPKIVGGSGLKQSMPVLFNGVVYKSLAEAERQTGICRKTIKLKGTLV